MDAKLTPLNNFHKRQGGQMVVFAEWEMPLQYRSIIEEHLAVRQKAGVFDVSHMGKASISGRESLAFIDFVMTNDFSKIPIGYAHYTVMCNERGGCMDDLVMYRLGEEEWLLCVNASNTQKDIEWLKKQAVKFDCEVKDVSSEFGQLAVQGPKAVDVLKELWNEVPHLKRFQFMEEKFKGAQVIISRTGYTGEDGFEIYCPTNVTEKLMKSLLEVGKAYGIQLAGLGARDSLRLEAGYPLYGREISEEITPLEAGLGLAVKFNKRREFIGEKALKQQLEEGVHRKVIYFKLEGRRIARKGAKIFAGKEEIGNVLSGTYSPSLGRPIGSGLILMNKNENELEVDIRGQREKIHLVVPPFIFKQ